MRGRRAVDEERRKGAKRGEEKICDRQRKRKYKLLSYYQGSIVLSLRTSMQVQYAGSGAVFILLKLVKIAYLID
ncbi:hypothetical protein ACOSP7_019567 [Xanthoceras sorbifolium]